MNQRNPAPGDVLARQVTAREFVAVIFRRKWLVIGLFVVTTLTVAVISFSTPTVYQSSSRVLIRRGEQQSLMTGYRAVVNDWEADLANEIEVARSSPVIARTQELLNAEAKGTPIQIKAGEVDAQVMGKSNVVALAYVDRNAKVAETVCDALTRAYIDFRQNSMSINYPKGFFENEISKVRADLDEWTLRRRNFVEANDAVNVPDQTHALIDMQASLLRRRGELQTDLAQNQAIVQVMESLRDRTDADMPALGYTGGADAVADLKRKVIDQEARVAQIQERYRDDAPEVVNARETLETLREMLKREVNTRIDLSQSKIQSVKAGIAVIERDIVINDQKLSAMPRKEIAISEMDREITVLKSRYEALSHDADQVRVTQKTTPSVMVVLLSPAGPAISKTSRDFVRLALAPVFSLVVGIGLAFFVDGLDVTVRTSGQAEQAIDLPVLAALNERRRRTTS